MNTKRKGGIAVAYAISYFTEKGFTILLPVIDCEKYDLVVDNGSLKKIQCKYTNEKANSSFYVDLRSWGRYKGKVYESKYIETDFNEIFIYCSNGDKYLIPIEKVFNKSSITLGKIYKEYKI